jgi:formylglycine-generating enzyme required for sulfatase activity
MKRVFSSFLTVILLFLSYAGLFAQEKYALVIGNGSYTGSGMVKLSNPVNDANDVSAVLQGLGFTVEKLLDANLDQMENAILRFKKRLSGSNNSYGFFYYSGHGVQSGGENFLIPVGANIPGEKSLYDKAVSVQWALAKLKEADNALNIVVLDACRDNPFAWKRSGSRGLTAVVNQSTDSIIVYAAGAGSTAADRTGRNSLFTIHLLNNLKTPNLAVDEVFKRTSEDVALASNRAQTPAVYSKIFVTAYLGSKPQAAEIKPADIYANMTRINGGTFMMGSPDNEPERDDDEEQHWVTVGDFFIGKYEVTVGEFQRFVNATGYRTEAETDGGGNVWMNIDWEMKEDANWKNPYFSQTDNHPVVLVSWNDAVQYCNWLSEQEKLTPVYTIDGKDVTLNKNANGYRLPTEEEWEYACRAGTTTPFSTGNNITTSQANYDGNYPYNNNAKGEYRKKTTAVGSFSPNAWGLYDMHGNVYEWCWDWYGNYQSEPQTDPMDLSSGNDRVVRGGSWYNAADSLRSSFREIAYPYERYNFIGFRLVLH